MPYPYSWTPTRLIPDSATQVKVRTVDDRTATLTTPISVTTGEIAFALATPGRYKIVIQKGTVRYTGIFNVDETGVDIEEPEQAEYTRTAPLDPEAVDSTPVLPVRYIAEDSENPGLYRISEGDTSGGRLVTVDDDFKFPAGVEGTLNATIDNEVSPVKRATRHRGLSILPGPVVATRSAYFERSLTDAGRCTRLKHIAAEEIIDLSLVYGNYFGFDVESNSSIRVRSSVEYPSGTFYKAHFTGEDSNRDVTITPGGFVNTQPVAIRIPKGATFYTNTLVVPATPGGQYPAGGIIIGAAAVGEKCNPNSATDYTTTANPGIASDQFAYGPVAVCAISPATVPSVGIVGDSISVGAGDATINMGYENGFIVRALNSQFPYIQAGHNGESGGNWGEANATDINRHRYRGPLVGSCDYIIQEHVTNDFGNNNKTVAATQVSLISSWKQLAARGGKVYQTTCTPRTTSTDAWATTLNQTGVNTRFGPEAGAGSDRQIFNVWMRDGAPILAGVAAAAGSNAVGTVRAGQAGHPLTGVIDSAAAVEEFNATTNTWAWKAGWTTDGIHPNSTAHVAMAATFNPTALFV